MEEYSAYHAASYDEIGNWPSRRFEAAWASHTLRRALDSLEADQRVMIQAMLTAGVEDPQDKITEVQQHFLGLREQLIRFHEDGTTTDWTESDEAFVEDKWW